MTTERFRSFPDLPRVPLGDGRELVYHLLRRQAHVLSATAVQVLAGCTAFESLDDCAARLAGRLRADPRPQLEELARLGLLVSEGQLTAACLGRPTSPAAPARIAVVGVPTRDRPASLAACLASHLDAARRRGRECAWVVSDDSGDAATRAANRQALRSLRERFGAEVYYAGPGERADFTAALACETGAPVEVVRFALVNDEGCPIATGGSRNTLLLFAAGEALLTADDDTLGRLVPVLGTRDGPALSSRPDPTEFWFPAGDAPDPGDAPGIEDDLPSWHERLLGRHPGGYAAETSGGVDVGQAGAGLFRRLEGEDSRVLVTMLGAEGDAGMGSSQHLLTLDGDSRARLLAPEAVYRHAVAHRRVLRGVKRPTVGDSGFCMAMHLGLDGRRLLPPFLPVQRNQDGVFAALVRCCFGGGLFGYLPRAVVHRPPAPRGTAGDPWADAGRVGTGQLFQVLIGALAPLPDGGEPQRNLAVLGRALADLAASTPASFEEVVPLHLWQAIGGWAARLEARLRAYGGQPAYWADDVRRVLANLGAALTDPEVAVPWDLGRAFGGDARAVTQGLVGRFGRLLQAWPDLVEGAQRLRARGVRPAAAL